MLALIDRMQGEDIPKAHWIVFYCVLLGRGWIEDNLAAFCKSMKALFDVNLDHRALSRNMKTWATTSTNGPKRMIDKEKRKRLDKIFENWLKHI